MPAPQVTLKINDEDLEDLRETLRGIPRGVPRVLSAAINRTLTTGRTRIKRKIAGILNVKQSVILENTDVNRASVSRLEGRIVFKRRPIPLIEFRPTETFGTAGKHDANGYLRDWRGRFIGYRPTGLDVTVRKDKGAEHHDHYFIATMKSGHKGVFVRTGKARLPIVEKMGPTVVGVLANAPGILDETVRELGGVLDKNIRSQVDRLLARRKHK